MLAAGVSGDGAASPVRFGSQLTVQASLFFGTFIVVTGASALAAGR